MKILRYRNINCSETYIYYGGFYDINHRKVLPDEFFTTTANSIGEAKSHILKQAKDALGMPVYYKLSMIHPDNLSSTQPLDVEDNHYCEECGSRLTDGGYCPICDDNDEEYYEE